jgi:anti-sigma regulatory factor (Ser/Thr protein kinase)
VLPYASFEETEARIEPASTLVLYTDGLVERREESLDVGLARLRDTARTAPTDLDRLADHLLDELLPGRQPGDDVALLAVRSTFDRDGFALDLPAWPRELAALRGAAREWLARVGVVDQAADDCVIAVNEAAANTIEHAYGLRDAHFAVRGHRAGGVVVFEVSDHGNWRAAHAAPDRGRGLDLIRRLMDEVDVQAGSTGTTVRLSRQV